MNRTFGAMTPEEKRAYYRARYAAHREKLLAQARARYTAHREKRLEWARVYRAVHREKLRMRDVARRRSEKGTAYREVLTLAQKICALERYILGEPVQNIADNCKISEATVSTLARTFGLPLRHPISRLSFSTRAEMGRRFCELAQRYKTRPGTVHRFALSLCPQKQILPIQHMFSDPLHEEIAQRACALAQAYDVNIGTLYRNSVIHCPSSTRTAPPEAQGLVRHPLPPEEEARLRRMAIERGLLVG